MESSKSQWARRTLAKLGLNLPILLLMLKGAIAPTVGLAIYQSDSVAKHFSTIGYLIPIMSILTLPVAPRARFFQNLAVTILLVGFAVAISFISMWCAIKARENTTYTSAEALSGGPVTGAPVSPYNAAASVNMAIWFAFEVWLANTLRSFRPQYFLPSIVFSIFIQVTSTYGTQFARLEQSASLIKRLVETFFAGFGLSAAVNVLIFPVTSRKLVTAKMTENLYAVQKALDAEYRVLVSLASSDRFVASQNSDPPRQPMVEWQEADYLQNAAMEVTRSFGDIKSELRYAKRETGWAHLGPKELAQLTHLLKKILAPILWMESRIKLMKRFKESDGWISFECLDEVRIIHNSENAYEEKQHWFSVLQQRRGPMEELFQAMRQGIQHSMYCLHLQKSPKNFIPDLESNRNSVAVHLEKTMERFGKQPQAPLENWLGRANMDQSLQTESLNSGSKRTLSREQERRQFQLFFILDLEYSISTAAKSILDLVRYADSKVNDGTMTKMRFVVLTRKQLKKWFWASLGREDRELDYYKYSRRSGSVNIYLRDILNTEIHPEHLPPRTMWERGSDRLRTAFHFFGSSESMFGLRVAVATMSVTLVAFLRNSQHFYIEQRFIWGSIMIAISMTLTVGSAIYGQSMRFIGTAIGMIISYIDWYIVDAQPAGVIVFVGVSMFLFHYILLRFPADPVIPIIGMVTLMLIIGYALQVKKVGVAISESNGQAYHSLFVLSPYRLATVTVGIGVAFIFTCFPHGSTVKSRMRKDLGSFLFILAHYYGFIYTSASLRVRNLAGENEDKNRLNTVLKKARNRVIDKEIVLLQAINQHTMFLAWEPTLGGQFPRKNYDRLNHCARNILQLSLILQVIIDSIPNRPTITSDLASSEQWLKELGKLITSLDGKSHEVTSFLSMISCVLQTASPLPLYLKPPKPRLPSQLLVGHDAKLLSVQHVAEPEYSAIAAIEITMMLLADELTQLLSETKALVGELNPLKDILGSKNLPAIMQQFSSSEGR